MSTYFSATKVAGGLQTLCWTVSATPTTASCNGLSPFPTALLPAMPPFRVVLARDLLIFIALALLAVHVAAAGDLEVDSISSRAAKGSTARFSTSNAADLQQGSSATFENAVDHSSSAAKGSRRNRFVQGSISRSSKSAFQEFGGLNEKDVPDAHQRSLAASKWRSSTRKKESFGLQIELYLVETDTSATVANKICDSLNASVSELLVYNDFSIAFQAPSCLGSSVLTYLEVRFMIVASWSVFPSSLEKLYCIGCDFKSGRNSPATPSASTPAAQEVDGFTADGSLAWDEIFPSLPNITTKLGLVHCQPSTACGASC